MNRFISLILTLVMIWSVASLCVVSAGAVTYISYGDYDLAVQSDSTYLIGGYHGSDTALDFPDSANGKAIIGIAEDFYDKCDSALVSVSMPESFSVVESFAFYGMTSLKKVEFSPNITSIGTMAFSGCSSLCEINLNETKVTSITYACFSDCGSLTDISLPDSLAAVGDYAFSKSGLVSVELPEKTTSIGAYSFNECSDLATVDLPFGLTSIGEYAFYNAASLTSVFVPGTVSQIGGFAFNPMAISGGSLTLNCFADSYAAAYAYDNYLNYEASEKVMGDADLDGDVDINDVTTIQLYRVNLISLGGKAIEQADVNADGKVTLRDATTIQMKLVGLIKEF